MKKKQTINLNNRRIERVALTQLEYGSFHDRFVFKHLLIALLNSSYETNSTDSKITEKFKKLEEKRVKWVEQYKRLCAINPDYPKNPFFDCWFMSLPQLLEIINLSSNNDSFYEIFKTTKHITYSTLDWYREFDCAMNLYHSS